MSIGSDYYHIKTKIPQAPPTYVPTQTVISVKPLQPSTTQKEVERLDAEWLNIFPNARYLCGDLEKLKRRGDLYRFNSFVEKSKFFMDTDDGEANQKRIFEEQWKDNPEHLTSLKNDRELEEKLNDPNNIQKEVFTDTGAGTFTYENENQDQVGLVKEANQSYLNRRDNYWIPEREMSKKFDLLNKKQELKSLMEELESQNHGPVKSF